MEEGRLFLKAVHLIDREVRDLGGQLWLQMELVHRILHEFYKLEFYLFVLVLALRVSLLEFIFIIGSSSNRPPRVK